MSSYDSIQPSGGSTGAPINLSRRIRFIERFLSLENKVILDSGCGEGLYVLKMMEYSDEVYGVEYDRANVEKFKKRGIQPDHVSVGDIERLDFPDGTFDLVLLNEVLEHVPNDAQAVREAMRVLKAGGLLAVFSPNRFYPFETHGATLKNHSVKFPHYFPFIPYIPVSIGKRFLDYHARNYFPWELKRLIAAEQFKIVEQNFIWQTFENISGHSPNWLKSIKKILRSISFVCEKIPVIKCFGVSQIIIAKKESATL